MFVSITDKVLEECLSIEAVSRACKKKFLRSKVSQAFLAEGIHFEDLTLVCNACLVSKLAPLAEVSVTYGLMCDQK